MNGNGKVTTEGGQVLCWPRRLLSADDLRRHLTGQSELRLLPRTIVTPLAADELKEKGVRITWQAPRAKEERASKSGCWGYAQEKDDPLVNSAAQALDRDGVTLAALDVPAGTVWDWAKAVAEAVARAECAGGVVFCADPGLVCCVANKVSGLRAAAVLSAAQATRARQKLGANLLAVEMPGRTFFELRQLLRTICGSGAAACPDELATALKELDGHAHR